jgi:hypothetical protein
MQVRLITKNQLRTRNGGKDEEDDKFNEDKECAYCTCIQTHHITALRRPLAAATNVHGFFNTSCVSELPTKAG